MANSLSREAALQDVPYQPTRWETTPRVHNMLANLSRQGPGTPPSPRSALPSPSGRDQSSSMAEATPPTVSIPSDYYSTPSPRRTPPVGGAMTSPAATTPADWTGPAPPSPSLTIRINPQSILSALRDNYRWVGGGSLQRRDLEHLTPSLNTIERSLRSQQPSHSPLIPITPPTTQTLPDSECYVSFLFPYEPLYFFFSDSSSLTSWFVISLCSYSSCLAMTHSCWLMALSCHIYKPA